MRLSHRVLQYTPRRLRERAGNHFADALHNAVNVRRDIHAPRPFLIVREHFPLGRYNDPFLGWVATNRPDALSWFELRRGPVPLRRLDRYSLFVPWVQDPLRERRPWLFRRLARMQAAFAERGVSTINRVESLFNSVKSLAAAKLRDAGVRVPRMFPITDPAAFRRDPDASGLSPPYFIRSDVRHGEPVFFIAKHDDLANVNWRKLEAPVAIEYVDVCDGDGLYRKWRSLVIGDRVLPRHIVASPQWFVHARDRVFNDRTVADELAFTGGEDPRGPLLRRAAEALGLDYVAFDYSFTRDGEPIIWEPNPMPVIWAELNHATRCDYQRPAVDRIHEALFQLFMSRAKP